MRDPQMLRATLCSLLACCLLIACSGGGDDEPAASGDDAGSIGSGGSDSHPSPDGGGGDGDGDGDGEQIDASDPLDAASEAEDSGSAMDADVADADVALPTDDASVEQDAAFEGDAAVEEDAAVMLDADLPIDDAGEDAMIDAALDAGEDSSVSLPEPDPRDWTSFGRDLHHSRTAQAETAIDSDSVSALSLDFRVEAPGVTGTPAIVGEVVYFADWDGGVHAHSIVDGDELWSQSLPRGFTSSPCVDGDKLYLADRHTTVYALDRASGVTEWSTEVDSQALSHMWSSPVVADGIVIVGLSSYGTQENRTPLPQETIAMFRGAIIALDAETGQQLWRFETTRPIGQPDMYGPGVSVWSSPAIDTERKALFVGTGNGYATPVSPYSDALLAIDYRTGVLAWHNQFTAFDAYSSGNAGGGPDYDIGATPNLFTIDDDGVPRDVVGVGDKAGIYRVLDRDSGQLIWQRTLEQGFFISSRKTGGIIAPAAYSEGRIFVASNTSSAASKVWALDAQSGAIDWVSASVSSVNFGAPAVANDVVFFGGSGFAVNENRGDGIGVGAPGNLTAYEASTGAVLRNLTLFAGRGGGFAVSRGRVFIGSGFSFFAVADEPLDGALEVFSVEP
jgi:polyvinyl alcohol dehydrogenase (cytochrome)